VPPTCGDPCDGATYQKLAKIRKSPQKAVAFLRLFCLVVRGALGVSSNTLSNGNTVESVPVLGGWEKNMPITSFVFLRTLWSTNSQFKR
jgi:hypothetical protein